MKHSSDMKAMLKEAGILFVITLISGLLLGFVYELTKEPIQLQQEKAVTQACQTVFAEAASFQEISYTASSELIEKENENGVKLGVVFEAKNGSGETIGYVISTTSTRGYGGNIVLYTGVSKEGTVKGVSILEISETAGLGMQASQVLVPQVKDKTVDAFTYTKNGSRADSEIDAISGATITTKAFVNAVNAAIDVSKELLGGAN